MSSRDPVTTGAGATLLTRAMPLIHERINKLTEAAPMLGFLFADEVDYDETDVAKVLDDGRAAGRRRSPRRPGVRCPTGPPRPSTRRCAPTLVDELGLKPRNAFGPVRVAVTGRRVSPPLFESLELLGREESLARLDAAPRPPGRAERCPTRHRAHQRAHQQASRRRTRHRPSQDPPGSRTWSRTRTRSRAATR